MGLEYKSCEIEVKADSEQGTFVGLASPYNNIDDGLDRVKPTVGKRNNNKRVPMLWQHDTKQVLGSLLLSDIKQGIQANGKLILDKDEGNQYMIPKAAEAYALLKKGLLKLSIGYSTLAYDYEKVNGNNVRNLNDIDIKEVSLVTFPMNEKATVSDVKGNGLETEKKQFGNMSRTK
ncbi:HK97 family phage prohead protease [Clostridium magnum]|uniref:HK97 family phage prohead protease n=1 Tax=Clostridium magnum TaxID=33954 RepID=UPI0009205A97|nr:HK97 family phage prohead protease [Clostridium magnum]SHJ14644.1 phage prohead protease, HK97 family [Clostridium magnum DSM 2767]